MTHIKKLLREDYEDVFDLSQFAFQYQLSEETLEKKKEEADLHDIWGWMEEGKLAAKLHNIPLRCYLNGKEFKMGGISAVATWPEYRRNGMVKKLLYHALTQQKKDGQTISFLHPFSFPFYRKYGWELTFVNKIYSVPMKKLKQNWNTDGYVRRIEEDTSLLQSIYSAYAKRFNGMLERDAQWWKYRVYKKPYQTAVAYDQEGNANGYLLYDVKDNIFSIQEIADLSLDAKKTLLQFIANHDSMADKVEWTVPENDNLFLLLEDPRYKQELIPYFMARIVDVEAFFQQFPFQQPKNGSVSFSITVEDDFLEDNNITIKLNSKNGTWEVSKSEVEEHAIRCSIQQLTVMMLSYKRPEKLFELGLITGSKKAVDQFAEVLPKQQTFLADFF